MAPQVVLFELGPDESRSRWCGRTVTIKPCPFRISSDLACRPRSNNSAKPVPRAIEATANVVSVVGLPLDLSRPAWKMP